VLGLSRLRSWTWSDVSVSRTIQRDPKNISRKYLKY
jgi:hypothetical protein